VTTPLTQVDDLRSELAAAGASGTWYWDIPTDTLHVDAKFAELYGIDFEESRSGVPTRTFFRAIHPDDRARIRIAVAGILAGAEVFSKEFRVVAPDGTTMWLHGRGQCDFDDQEQPVRFTGVLVDVTERKRTEERLRIAQSAGGVGTFEYIDGYATATVSEEFCKLLGLYPALVLPTQTINGVTCPGQEPLIPGPRREDMPTTLEGTFEILRSDDHEHRWITRRGEIFREGSGYRLVGVIYDVTHAKQQEAALRDLNDTLESRIEQESAVRRAAEEALRQSQKIEAIGQLTGGIAHDFNNLLMAISSSLELLKKRLPQDDPQIVRLIDNAQQGAHRGAALTQRMLAFARRQDLNPVLVDVADLLRGMMDLIQRTLGPAWHVECDFGDNIPPVLADANQLEMAILNLAVNARDSMPDGGPIRISAEQQQEIAAGDVTDLDAGDYVVLRVIDRGEGMDEKVLSRAMEPFFTTKGVGKGTGLGLSMIHGLARQLGGSFTLTSQPKQGTIASLWLPAANVAAANPEIDAPRNAQNSLECLTILAVDDDPLILLNTAAMLEDLGHRVLEAASPHEALILFEQYPEIDLVMTDQAMPGMTGTQLAARIEVIRPNVPMILATGYGELPEGMRATVVKLGKPFNQSALESAISEAISRFRH